MKMSKKDRDEYVKDNQDKTIKNLAEHTGWSETTIKSVRRRLGICKKTPRQLEIEEYCLNNYPQKSEQYIANHFTAKVDNIRDTLKSLGIYNSVSDKAFENLKIKYPTFSFGEYKCTKTPISLECTKCAWCGSRRPNNLVTSRFVCPGCYEEAWNTQEDLLEAEQALIKELERQHKLIQRYPSIDNFIDGDTVISRCPECSGTRRLRVSSLKSRPEAKCPPCAYKSNNHATEFYKDMKTKEYTIVSGDYLNGLSKITVKCKNGHTRTAGAYNLRVHGCPQCRSGSLLKLYLMKYNNWVKIGVSNNPEERRKKIAYEAKMQGLEVVHEFKGEYSKVLEAEKFWHNLFKDKQVGGLEPFGGYLEFFELSEEDIAMILKAPLCNSLKS